MKRIVPQIDAGRNRPRRGRHGLTMAEVLAAAVLMSVVTVVALPVVSGVAKVRDESVRRNLAVIEVSNVMERLAALRRQRALTEELLAAQGISAAAAAALDSPEIRVDLGDPQGTPAVRELTVSLSWLNDAGDRVAPVSVSAFLYENEGGQ